MLLLAASSPGCKSNGTTSTSTGSDSDSDTSTESDATSSATSSANTTSSTNPTTAGSGSASSDTSSATSDAPTTAGSETSASGVCGDGNVDPGETCDDGNDDNTDQCTDQCEAAACGDGYVQVGEQCDDGPDIGANQACLDGCVANVCGDFDEGPDEGCDDGNEIDGDGCDSNCLLEDVDPEAILCGNKLYECGDTIDNDGDGKIDLNDGECTTPCDDDEGSFQTSLPGQNKDCKSDCYFDIDSGQGNDHCIWDLQCDPENPGAQIGCEYDPDKSCELQTPPECIDFCSPITPNGCDCFGCCEIAGMFIYLDSSPDCSLDNLEACEPCTFFEGCNNPCMPEMCEICFGQDPGDLPPGCDEPKCEEWQTPCINSSDCPDTQFCSTGCCIDIIPE